MLLPIRFIEIFNFGDHYWDKIETCLVEEANKSVNTNWLNKFCKNSM